MRVARLWRHIRMLKRGGLGHDPSGLAGASLGSCAIECPACPHPNISPRVNGICDEGVREESNTL